MRLINTETGALEEYFGTSIPEYAILSHTWGAEEVSFQDMSDPASHRKRGWEKIRKTSQIAAGAGHTYVWIDTCCIDKSSSTELAEAINSMFCWYKYSTVCYVYLSDVPRVVGPDSDLYWFRKSRWFSRGWTLQELIAPKELVFLRCDWSRMGTKRALLKEISAVTSIPSEVLLTGEFSDSSIMERMGWASNRSTTRQEDIAYCMLGLFDINMPMLYGEGEKAFERLQEEIIKVSDDPSIFFWQTSEIDHSEYRTLFARSPAEFPRATGWKPKKHRLTDQPYQMSNMGLNITLLMDSSGNATIDERDRLTAWLFIEDYNDSGYAEPMVMMRGIFLQRVNENSYARVDCADHAGSMRPLSEKSRGVPKSITIPRKFKTAKCFDKDRVRGVVLKCDLSKIEITSYQSKPANEESANGKLLFPTMNNIGRLINQPTQITLRFRNKSQTTQFELQVETKALFTALESTQFSPLSQGWGSLREHNTPAQEKVEIAAEAGFLKNQLVVFLHVLSIEEMRALLRLRRR